MRIEYTYEVGSDWGTVANDLLVLIAEGAQGLANLNAGAPGLSSVVGDPFRENWVWNGWQLVLLDGSGGYIGGWEAAAAAGTAAEGARVWALEYEPAGGSFINPSVVPALICGQNSLNGGAVSARGTIRAAVNEHAAVISFPYAGVRQVALLGAADGDYFDNYPRVFVMSSVGAIAGLATAVTKVPYFPRVKNPAAAGDKTGLAAAGLAFAPGISATNGWVYGVNESLVYQALPLEVFSSPKAAHLGYVRGVMLAPCKGVANDDYLNIGGEQYLVFRENATAALALALKV